MELDLRVSNIKKDIKELKNNKKWYNHFHEKYATHVPAGVKDPVKFKNWNEETYNSLVEENNRKIKHRQQLIKNYKSQEEEKMLEIEYYLQMSENARKKELWKKEIKTFYGLE